jgi:branched-subunit amino acid transport protein AzlD
MMVDMPVCLHMQNWLGIGIMVLLVVYHYVTVDVQPQQPQQQ